MVFRWSGIPYSLSNQNNSLKQTKLLIAKI